MQNKNNAPVFVLRIVAIIVGIALYKQFDFKTMQFEKPVLAAVYAITFLFSVYVIIKDFRKKRSEK
ncbi:hypothetical protein HYN56_09530 [Flavobacterium crocinum]|uniref:Uncharacterized protein n=1 Tax=Flavobacterium crocinum TaxID=2183896 RepID=A0A2S1YK57_9FLAO|nr:hypothetical protein [Flavobacterium crocinum]AWK04461.1 hypothetical protein HYN56_09530 [Flavobacterium crocinum]